jgi:hypothetical protein
VVLVILAAVAWLVSIPAATAAGGTELIGTFSLTPGSCTGGVVSGTYLRMILPSGGPTGPYLSNSDSRCPDQSFTPLSPGTQGGLISGSYQPEPTPPFDATGNALAGAITAPAQFYGTSFATSANKVDPQTHRSVNAPLVTVSGSALHADLRGFAVTWNSQYFNQGSPKPDGSYPGNTRAATGTYNASTGAFTLSWTSQVVGGPFDKFTGQWHLQGFFHAARGGTASAYASVAPSHVAARSVSRTSSAGVVLPTGSALSAATASAASSAARPVLHASPASLTTATRTRTTWHVSVWLLLLLIAIAVLGFAALWQLNRAARSGAPT